MLARPKRPGLRQQPLSRSSSTRSYGDPGDFGRRRATWEGPETYYLLLRGNLRVSGLRGARGEQAPNLEEPRLRDTILGRTLATATSQSAWNGLLTLVRARRPISPSKSFVSSGLLRLVQRFMGTILVRPHVRSGVHNTCFGNMVAKAGTVRHGSFVVVARDTLGLALAGNSLLLQCCLGR